ncbi:MAG: right-handed parallel beta-helix repeat-containing protein [Bacteroidales bacterium]|nr:right-handed parallel beta-helix repeat-containing protein [Bacteroidales bacterium]
MKFSVLICSFLLCSSFVFSNPDTVNITSFGLSPDSRVNAVPYVQKALVACKGKTNTVVFFPKGRYDFWPHQCIEKVYYESNTSVVNPRRCAIVLEGLTGITMDCGGSDFVFHDRIQPFSIDKSQEVSVKQVSIDWDIPLLTDGEVIEVNPNYMDIRIDPIESPYLIEKDKLVFVGEGWKSDWWGTMEFDRETRAVACKTGDYGCMGAGWNNYKAEELSSGLIRLHYAFKRLPAKGNYLVLRHSDRDHSGIFVTDSRNVLLEDVNMYHNAGLGILSQYSSDLTYRRVNSVPNPAKNRIFSGHDDGLHFSNCAGQITVDHCTFHALMDDPINVHGTSTVIKEKTDSNTLICKFVHEQSIGMVWARPGEKIGFIDNNSMLTIGAGMVDRFETLQDDLFKLHFRDPLPDGIKEGFAMENLAWTPDVLVTGCRFESCRARGVLISTPGKVIIENNTFESSGSAILIAGDANAWYESGGVKDILIRNNHFTDLCLTSMYQFCEAIISIYPEIPKPDGTKPGYHKNIRIENNQFEVYDYPVLYAKSTDDLTFTGNILKASQRFKPWHPRKYSVSLEFCKNVTVRDNVIDPAVLGRNIHLSNMKKSDLKMGKGQFKLE